MQQAACRGDEEDAVEACGKYARHHRTDVSQALGRQRECASRAGERLTWRSHCRRNSFLRSGGKC
jgi:hypothetical protein